MLCSTVPGNDPSEYVTQGRRKLSGILAPTAQHLPEQQAAGLEQSQGRNAISLGKKKKITAHLPILTAQGKQAAIQNKAASVL